MKALIDTNILVDVALERQPFFAASDTVLSFAESGQITGYISASACSDLFYIIRKNKGRVATIAFLQEIITFCRIATVDRAIIESALISGLRDFEDAIQLQTAIAHELDALVTRNPQDFATDQLQVLTPIALIQAIAP